MVLPFLRHSILIYIVRMLAKPIALACLAQALSKALADGCLWLPLAANAAPPAPYLANSL